MTASLSDEGIKEPQEAMHQMLLSNLVKFEEQHMPLNKAKFNTFA